MHVAEGLLDEAHQLSAVLQLEFDVGLILRDRTIGNSGNTFAYPLNSRIVHSFVRVLLQTRLSAHQADSGAVVDRVLPFQPASNVLFIAAIHDQRRYPYANSLDGIWRRVIVAIEVDTAVDGWMHHEIGRAHV